MPTVRKVAAEAVQEPARGEVARAYDALLAGFAAGEWAQVKLDAGERRVAVRARLQAAVRRRGLALRFRPGPGPMIFCVEQA